jgi:anti-anti-sigma regulatory factor
MGKASSQLKVAPTESGCRVRVEGHGTMHESTAARDVALRTLSADSTSVVAFDLTGCDYLDSTFLGLLTELFRKHGRGTPTRFYVAASPDARKRLLGTCRLDKIIPSQDDPPETCGPWVTVATDDTDQMEMLRHMLECHRALAEADCPARPAFLRLVDQLERELAAKA